MNKRFLPINEIEREDWKQVGLRARRGDLVRLDDGSVVAIASVPSSLNIYGETMIVFDDFSCGLLSDCDTEIVEILGRCAIGLYE